MYIYSLIAYIQTLSKQHISGTSHPEESSQSVQNVLLGSTRSPVNRNWEKTFTLAEEDKSNTVALELVNSNDSQIEEISFWPVWFYRYNWIEYV